MATGNSQSTDQVQKGHPCQVAEFGCNGAVPQTAVAKVAAAAVTSTAVATTAATNVSPYGFASAAQADALVALANANKVDVAALLARLNVIQTALVANGILV